MKLDPRLAEILGRQPKEEQTLAEKRARQNDVAARLLQPTTGGSFCEWKGPAKYWNLVDADRKLTAVAWSYPEPLAGAEELANCVAFYPASLDCQVDGTPVKSQPGGFYGGWITHDLVGPFKGEAGSEHW